MPSAPGVRFTHSGHLEFLVRGGGFKKKTLLTARFLEYIVGFNVILLQHGDTLKFIGNNRIVDTLIMGEIIQQAEAGEVIYNRSSKVSEDNKHYLLYEEKYFTANDSIFTKLALYNVNKEKIWERISPDDRKISFSLTDFCGDFIVYVTTDKYGANPSMEFIKNGKSDGIIKKNEWHRLVNYSVSPNKRYLLLHVKNPYINTIWDYIHFVDLKNGDNWTYLFSTCISCKRSDIALNIDDNGQSEVVHKGEHRVFSRKGELIDIFIRL